MPAPFRPSDEIAPSAEQGLLKLFRQRDTAVTILRRFVAEHDPEETPADAGCVYCTDWTVPTRLETRPCAYHEARELLAAIDRRTA